MSTGKKATKVEIEEEPQDEGVPQVVENQITDGTWVHQVTDPVLAACLVAIGIPLREDPPYTHVKLKSGEHKWVFNFGVQTTDGDLTTSDMIRAFREDMKFIDENPRHAFTFAMCAVKNWFSFRDHMDKDVPLIGFQSPDGDAVLLVKEGTRKHKNCVKHGMVRADPPKPEGQV